MVEDEVQAFRHRKPEEINLDAAAARSSQLRLIEYAIWVPLLILGLLVAYATITQGPENWQAVQSAERTQ